jgi:flagellar basal-body rod modification protein FlgD
MANSTSGIGATSATDPLASSSTTATGSANANNNLASEDTFLKLFVAQLKNQDPLNPNQQDPTQMVSELAQFSQLEQMVNIGSDVHSISQNVASATSAATAASGSGSGSGSNNSGTSATSGS